MSGERYQLTIEAQAGAVPAIARLRRLLKALLRAGGWRCVAIIALAEEPKESAK